MTAGTDLTGGGNSGSVTLNLDTTKVPLLASANTFTAAQTISAGTHTGLTATGLTGISGVSNGFGTGVTGSGVTGVNGSGGVFGIDGTGTEAGATGIYGTGGGPSGTTELGAGVVGTSNVGVIGYSTEKATANSSGAYPITAGVYAQAGTISAVATNLSGGYFAGLFADGGAKSGALESQVAILATTDDNFAGRFTNDSSLATVSVGNEGTGDTLDAFGGGGDCLFDGSGDLSCTGTLSGSNIAADKRALTTYGVQAAENWYEDAGSGQLQNGAAHIALDPTFGAVVNTEVEYHVFLTPKGDANNLFVTNETANGFDVRESRHGTSSIAFDYRIMAKRKGYEGVRLEDVTEKMKARQERQLKMRGGRGVKGVSRG